jgi:RNA polymerase sigma-70 factor, ECF subfamily
MTLSIATATHPHGALDAVLLGCAGTSLLHARSMSPLASRPAPADASAAPLDAARTERDARLAALLAASARGNTSAFEEFFDATAGYARALARRVLRSDDTDDLLADAFFEAWRAAARFDPARGSAVTWLLVIVRSRALDLLRQRAAHPSVAGTDTAEHELADETTADPSERLWQQQAGTRLHAALQLLTAAERWVLGLAYFRELTHAEIAARTRMPLGTVKSHITRAHTKLRDHLSPACR